MKHTGVKVFDASLVIFQAFRFSWEKDPVYIFIKFEGLLYIHIYTLTPKN